jgi:hypothetical protein
MMQMMHHLTDCGTSRLLPFPCQSLCRLLLLGAIGIQRVKASHDDGHLALITGILMLLLLGDEASSSSLFHRSTLSQVDTSMSPLEPQCFGSVGSWGEFLTRLKFQRISQFGQKVPCWLLSKAITRHSLNPRLSIQCSCP